MGWKKSVLKPLLTATNRKNLLFADFLSGAGKDATKWKQTYLGNPVLNAVARLIVWKQEQRTFTLTVDGPVDCCGNPYTIMDAPIGVAHPMEMPQEVATWQTYFMDRGLKQPFEQVWEPVYQPQDVQPDRYVGSVLYPHQLTHREAHGIHTWGISAYSEDFGFYLTDCKMAYECPQWRYAQDSSFTLGTFTFEKYTRFVNHIVYMFDKWTITDRLLADDASIEPMLNAFTAAQIQEFIRLTTEKECTNCTAMLLNYQNQHFSAFDPMAEFTLDL